VVCGFGTKLPEKGRRRRRRKTSWRTRSRRSRRKRRRRKRRRKRTIHHPPCSPDHPNASCLRTDDGKQFVPEEFVEAAIREIDALKAQVGQRIPCTRRLNPKPKQSLAAGPIAIAQHI